MVFASNWNEENLHVTLGISSDDLATFAAVYTINLTEIGEQLPNEVEPSTATVGAGTDWATVMAGSMVANISLGTSVLKNRTAGSKVNCCMRRRQPRPTVTTMDRFAIEHAGLAPSSAVLLAANNWLHAN